MEIDEGVLRVYLNALPFLCRNNFAMLKSCLCYCVGWTANDLNAERKEILHQVASMFERNFLKATGASNLTTAKTLKRNPVILMLDRTIQHLPWESMPILRPHPGKYIDF
jgi:hypothetical protein